MNFNNFTIKSQEAVQEAVNLVQSRGQQAIEPVHIMQGVMKVGENVTNFIFQKLGMNGQQVALVVDKQIDSLPKVSGGEPYLSRESNEVLQKASLRQKQRSEKRMIASFFLHSSNWVSLNSVYTLYYTHFLLLFQDNVAYFRELV